MVYLAIIYFFFSGLMFGIVYDRTIREPIKTHVPIIVLLVVFGGAFYCFLAICRVYQRVFLKQKKITMKKIGLPLYNGAPLPPKGATKVRYFMISYMANVDEEYTMVNTIAAKFVVNFFPSKSQIVNHIKFSDRNVSNIAILSIQELKLREYEDFIR